jgi:hypothetical protein
MARARSFLNESFELAKQMDSKSPISEVPDEQLIEALKSGPIVSGAHRSDSAILAVVDTTSVASI